MPRAIRIARLPRCKFSAEQLFALLEKRRYNACPQHKGAMQQLAELAVRYHWVGGVAECNEVVARRSSTCQVEVKLRVGKNASAASRQEFVEKAISLGWHHRPNHDERLIWLVSSTGVRLPDGSLMPVEGTKRIAIFERCADMFGERLTMIDQPAFEINLDSRTHQAEELSKEQPGREYVVRAIQWHGGRWQVAPDEGNEQNADGTP